MLAEFAVEWVRALAARAAGGFGIAIPDPGFPQLRPETRPAATAASAALRVGLSFRPGGPRTVPVPRRDMPRATKDGSGSIPRSDRCLVGLRWSHVVFGHLPVRVPVRTCAAAARPRWRSVRRCSTRRRCRRRRMRRTGFARDRKDVSTKRARVGVRSDAADRPHAWNFKDKYYYLLTIRLPPAATARYNPGAPVRFAFHDPPSRLRA